MNVSLFFTLNKKIYIISRSLLDSTGVMNKFKYDYMNEQIKPINLQ